MTDTPKTACGSPDPATTQAPMPPSTEPIAEVPVAMDTEGTAPAARSEKRPIAPAPVKI